MSFQYKCEDLHNRSTYLTASLWESVLSGFVFKYWSNLISRWTLPCKTKIYSIIYRIFPKSIIWASTLENLSSGVCEQHRHRPSCTSTQTDQRLYYSLFEKYHIYTCFEQNFNYLASLYIWAGWIEAHFVRNPKERFSRNAAHMISGLEVIRHQILK